MRSELPAIALSSFPTPIGALSAYTWGEEVLALEFFGQGKARCRIEKFYGARIVAGPMPERLHVALGRYFDQADSSAFKQLKLRPAGSAFQLRVWNALLSIPLGESISYGSLARLVGSPRAARAVGAANGQNPIPIIIPCHRVIGSSGQLTGYGSGIDRKAWLLRHEGAAQGRGWFVQQDLDRSW